MLTIYKIVANLLYLLCLPILIVKGRKHPEIWNERRAIDVSLSALDKSENSQKNSKRAPRVWFHASSVGETKVLARLVASFKKKCPELKYYVSNYTVTGRALSRQLFPDALGQFYFPLDCYHPLKRFFSSVSPDAVVMVETEIWPYFIDCCRKHGVPLFLANGRLSEKSTGRYRMFKPSFQKLFASYKRFLMQSDVDRDRIISIGAIPERVVAIGNIKHDPEDVDRAAKRHEIRQALQLADNDFLFIAASTRPGEEELICDAVLAGIKKCPGMKTIIAPRHLERLADVQEILEQKKLSFSNYSDASPVRFNSDVILMDRIGLLSDLFYGADLAFVGGTIAEIGGHNIMEPVLRGVPVLYGRSIFNVTEAHEIISNGNLGKMISSGDELSSELVDCVSGQTKYSVMMPGKTSSSDRIAEIILADLNPADHNPADVHPTGEL